MEKTKLILCFMIMKKLQNFFIMIARIARATVKKMQWNSKKADYLMRTIRRSFYLYI